MREWLSAAEWAEMKLPGLPGTTRGMAKVASREGWQFRERAGRGGGLEYHYGSLPEEARTAYVLRHHVLSAPAPAPAPAPKAAPLAAVDPDILWTLAEGKTDAVRAEGKRRMEALVAAERLMAEGAAKMTAYAAVAAETGESVSTIRGWFRLVRGVDRCNWMAALTPRWGGRSAGADCDPEAWDWYKGQYLTRQQPSFADTYDRLKRIAAEKGWTIPSARTLQRRLETEVSPIMRAFHRKGVEAASRMLPKQQRDVSVFAAGEAVNGDGLKFDRLWVRFPDGEILNTTTGWFWQDIRTRRILAHRIDKTENTDLFRLATYDLTAVCAPRVAYIDNTRVAANKLMTAGAPGRHRFKIDPDDGLGLLMMLGMEPHFTNPDKETGNPGAKPIERAFGIGGIHDMVATNPAFVNRGYSKATAIPVEELRAVVAQEVARHNDKEGRRTQACRGVLSFDQAWAECVGEKPLRMLSDSQRRLLLLSREVVRVDETGVLTLKAGAGPNGRNRYHAEHLHQFVGRKVAVHFNPEALDGEVYVYSLDGQYLFAAAALPSVGFNSTADSREWNKQRRRQVKAIKKAAEAEKRMTDLERAALYSASVPTDGGDGDAAGGDPKVIAAHFARTPDPLRDAPKVRAATASGPEDDEEEFDPIMIKVGEMFARQIRSPQPVGWDED